MPPNPASGTVTTGAGPAGWTDQGDPALVSPEGWADHDLVTLDTVVQPRRSPTGRVPVWLLVEDALDSVSLVDGWRDLERAVHHPSVPVLRREPGGRLQERALRVLGAAVLALSVPALALLDLLHLGD